MPTTSHPPVLLGPRFVAAVALATDLHRDQRRKCTAIPYLSHLLSVAALILEAGGDEEQAIAGLLHDAAEDQGGDAALGRIRREFGDRVAGMVESCTDTVVTPKPPWQARKEAYLAHLEAASPDAVLVSLADKVHNARSIAADVATSGATAFQRFSAGRDGTLWYYRSLLEVFLRRGLHPVLIGELRLAVERMGRV